MTRDGVNNQDTSHPDEDLTDLYRLYLDYKINSIQEPAGYQPLEGPLKIVVGESDGKMTITVTLNGKAIIHPYLVKDSSTGAWTLQVVNNSGIELPHTGASGTRAFTVVGWTLIIGAILAFVRRRVKTAA